MPLYTWMLLDKTTSMATVFKVTRCCNRVITKKELTVRRLLNHFVKMMKVIGVHVQ